MKKLKGIKFNLDITGMGIVNYAGDEESYIPGLGNMFKNSIYGKKNYYRVIDKDGNERITSKLKISSNCLRSSLFGESYVAQSASLMHNDDTLYRHLGTDYAVIRGYLLASKTVTYKRKSPFTITDAEQVCDAYPIMETCAQSGYKEVAEKGTIKGKDDKKGVTYYKKNTVGHIKYKSCGTLNLNSLELISCDQLFDRYGFNEDYFPLLNDNLKLNGITGNLGYYMLNGSVINLAERAFKLDSKSRIKLIKKQLQRLLDYSIEKNGAYAEREELTVKLTFDAMSDGTWVTISNSEDIENLLADVELFEYYSEVDEKSEILKRATINANMKKDAQKVIDDKAEVAAARKTKKEEVKLNDTPQIAVTKIKTTAKKVNTKNTIKA